MIFDSASAVSAARRAWDDYRRRHNLMMLEMRVGAFRRTDTSYVVELWPANPRTYGGGVVIEARRFGRTTILRILE